MGVAVGSADADGAAEVEGVAFTVSVPVGEVEGVAATVRVTDAPEDAVGVGVACTVPVGVGDLDGDAPRERVAEGVGVSEPGADEGDGVGGAPRMYMRMVAGTLGAKYPFDPMPVIVLLLIPTPIQLSGLL